MVFPITKKKTAIDVLGAIIPNIATFSLGISILELASDLDLPRGGLLWHNLRSGQLPEEFLRGRSCELKRTIAWMMEPDPFKRPTVDEVLESQTVRTVRNI